MSFSGQNSASNRPPNKTLALIISSISVFAFSFMIPAMNVALPAIGAELRADAISLGWMVTVYVVAIAVFSIPSGRLSDIVGIKKTFGYGLIVYTLSCGLIAAATTAWLILVGRALQGIGSAMILVNSLAMVTAIYPARERGRALGISLGCIFVGSAAGPFVGGILTEHAGWRSVFLATVPIGVALIVLLFWKIQGEWAAARGEKFDYLGSGIYALALIGVMYGIKVLPQITGAAWILAGLALLIVFYWWERRSASPAFNVNVFKNNRPFVFSCLAALVYFSANSALMFLISLYLQYIKGFTPQSAGLVLMLQPVVQALLSPFAGRLSDKVEPRIVATIGMLLSCLGLFSLIFLSRETQVYQILVSLIVIGAGLAFFLSPNTNAIMGSVSHKFLGVASASMSTMISIGQMLSMGITMIIIAALIGGVEITPQYYAAFISSARIGFGVFSLLALAGIFISLYRGKIQSQPKPGH